MPRPDPERTNLEEAVSDEDLDHVTGGQGIDIVRMPPKPRDPNEDFVVTDRRGTID